MENRRISILQKSCFAAVFALLAVSGALWAQDGITASTGLEVQASTLPEVKVLLHQSFTIPVLQGGSPLTSGNNLKTTISLGLTPISLNGYLNLTLTPIAFLEVSGGGRVGSGWNLELLGMNLYGIGMNTPIPGTASPVEAEITGDSFDGLHWSAWGGGAFQFDFGAIFPGDWNHVLLRTYHEARYAAFTRAGAGESWVFENDPGENQNGWVYNASYVLGYQMPRVKVLNLVALMADMRKYLYDTPNGDKWGDNLGYWTGGGLFNFAITPAFNAAMAVQMRTVRNFSDEGSENAENIYYRELRLSESGPSRKLEFYRVAFLLNYKLR